MEAGRKSNFQVAKQLIFYEAGVSQFRFQTAFAGTHRTPYISFIKFYKNREDEIDWKPTRKFITIPLSGWENFKSKLGDFNKIVEDTFNTSTTEIKQNISTPQVTTFPPLKEAVKRQVEEAVSTSSTTVIPVGPGSPKKARIEHRCNEFPGVVAECMLCGMIHN